MQSRYTLGGGFLPYVFGVAIAVPMAVSGLRPVGSRWAQVERTVTFVFSAAAVAVCLVILYDLVQDILRHNRELDPITLLTTAVVLWVANVLNFTFVYWQLDRGGPDARAFGRFTTIDFSFAQGNPGEVPLTRQPRFPDYLYLGFSTATAFSACDTLPLTTRAKMLMMSQAAISLVTLVIVAARALNVLK